MPGRDRTGPLGQGALTGRGLGPCGAGLGFRFGTGRGFGFRRFGFQGSSPVEFSQEQERKVLEAELAEVEAEKAELQKKLKELK